jgi:hypothetical protein
VARVSVMGVLHHKPKYGGVKHGTATIYCFVTSTLLSSKHFCLFTTYIMFRSLVVYFHRVNIHGWSNMYLPMVTNKVVKTVAC